MDPKVLSELLSRPASDFAQKDVVYLDVKASVRDAAAKMKESGYDSVIVTDGALPVGMLTDRDLCYRVLAEGRDPKSAKVGDVMSKPLITLSKSRTLSEALNLMAERNTRRLVLVNADGTIFGLVTRWGFTGQGTQGTLGLPVNHEGSGMVCPFCASLLEDAEALSKHIDRVHIAGEVSDSSVPLWTKKE